MRADVPAHTTLAFQSFAAARCKACPMRRSASRLPGDCGNWSTATHFSPPSAAAPFALERPHPLALLPCKPYYTRDLWRQLSQCLPCPLCEVFLVIARGTGATLFRYRKAFLWHCAALARLLVVLAQQERTRPRRSRVHAQSSACKTRTLIRKRT